MVALSVLLIGFLWVFLPCCTATEYRVYPTADSCPAVPSCLTLRNYLINASHYFTSNTSFIFQPGEHSLEDTLALHDVVNVTLRGADRRARITVSSGGVISCNISSSVSVSSMEIVFYGRADNSSKSALLFNNCTLISNNQHKIHRNRQQIRVFKSSQL